MRKIKLIFVLSMKLYEVNNMTMHLVRGMSSLNNKKRKMKKKPGWKNTLQEHDEFLKRMGVTGKKSEYRPEIPNYRENSPRISTSDTICSNGTRKESTKYTGDEIAGIVVTHKSNLMPIRKDNKQAAVDAASMRR